MAFVLDPLPYAMTALAPHISAETLDFHYNKHHAAYVTKLNAAVASNPALATQSLEALVRQEPKSLPAGVYNNAAQTWNHTFYWKSMASPSNGGGGEPSPAFKAALTKDFGSYEKFKEQFSAIAGGHFGSGWAWLVQDQQSGQLKIVDTHDAGNPMTGNPQLKPLLTCDVWEHAYYIDYRNARPKYVEAWWSLVNWKFAESNWKPQA